MGAQVSDMRCCMVPDRSLISTQGCVRGQRYGTMSKAIATNETPPPPPPPPLFRAPRFQQAFLVSAGVTTAELRTRRSPRPPPSSPGDESSSSAGHPGTNGSRSSAVRGLSLARSPAAPAALPTSPPTAARSSTRRRSSSFSSSAGRLIGNWWRFLAGTELPPGTTGAPLPGRGAVAAERAAAVVVVSPFEGEGHTPEAVDVTAAAAAVEPAARPWRDRGKLS